MAFKADWTGRLERTSLVSLWLFAAVALLSIAAQNVIFIGLAAWLLKSKGLPRVHPALRWYLPFLVLALLASWMSENRSHSLTTWRRWLLVFALPLAADALRQERPLRAVLGSLLFFSGLWSLGASLWALHFPFAAWLNGLPWSQVQQRWIEHGDWRAVSGSGGYMVLGSTSMLALVFFGGLALEDKAWRKPLPLTCMVALGLALLLTLTRSAWMGAAAGLGVLLLWKRPFWALVLGLGMVPLFLIPGSPLRGRLQQGTDMAQASTRERIYMAQAGLQIIKERPWLGVGDAMESWDGGEGWYRRRMPQAASQDAELKDREQGHLHNNAIQVAAMYGLPALLLLLAFFARLSYSGWRAAKSGDPLSRGLGLGGLAAMLAWWVNGAFEFNFGSTQSGFVLWFLLGLMLVGTTRPGAEA